MNVEVAVVSVGIEELAARLNSHVERVRQGEEIVVTDCGQEVALLVPFSRERRAVNALVSAGKARWSGGKPAGVAGIAIKGEPLAETVLEDRR
ncbi:MAG: type II toxin-antitoxin system prevent-host-death family antitoxin [Pseudomonadota bacterium]|nr:type II toxin-antitoxin system prevent-host-death family antitoxin [Pseudomonadota bacterium]